MKVKVVRQCRWDNPGKFPTFEKGTQVLIVQEEDAEFLGWYVCEILGQETYVPIAFVCDGKLTRDYNPTELTQETGDILEVQEIVNAWLFATNVAGDAGWVPAECVVSAAVGGAR